MKKMICSLLTVAMLMGCGVNVFAVSYSESSLSENRITSDYFCTALVKEFEKHGIELEIKSIDPTFEYTYDILNAELEKVANVCERYQANKSQEVEEEGLQSTQEYNPIAPKAMPGSVTCTSSTYVMFPPPLPTMLPAEGRIRNKAVVDVDYQRNVVTSARRPTISLISGTYLADYCVLKSYRYSYNNSNSNYKKRYAQATITATLKQSYAIPGGESWIKVDHTYSCKFYPFS